MPILAASLLALGLGSAVQTGTTRWSVGTGPTRVTGILLKPEGKGPFPAVLISHGRGGSAIRFGIPRAQEMVKWGYVCIAPDYTHAPGGGGDATTYGGSSENVRRATACLDALRKMPEVDPKRLYAYGNSMGGFVTIALAAQGPAGLRAAAISASGIGQAEGFPAPSPAVAQKVRIPFLMLHGGKDLTVRPQQSEALKAILDAAKVPNERHVFSESGHGIDQGQRAEVFRRIREWFAAHGGAK